MKHFWNYCRLKLHKCCAVCGYFTLTVYFVLQNKHIKSRTRNTHFNQGFSLYLTFNWNISHIVNWFAVFRQDLPQPKDANSCGVFVAWYNYCNIPSFFLKRTQDNFIWYILLSTFSLVCHAWQLQSYTSHPDSCTEIREVCMPHILKTQHLFVLLSLNCVVWSSVCVQANNEFRIGKLMVLHFSFKKQERKIGLVRKMSELFVKVKTVIVPALLHILVLNLSQEEACLQKP